MTLTQAFKVAVHPGKMLLAMAIAALVLWLYVGYLPMRFQRIVIDTHFALVAVLVTWWMRRDVLGWYEFWAREDQGRRDTREKQIFSACGRIAAECIEQYLRAEDACRKGNIGVSPGELPVDYVKLALRYLGDQAQEAQDRLNTFRHEMEPNDEADEAELKLRTRAFDAAVMKFLRLRARLMGLRHPHLTWLTIEVQDWWEARRINCQI